MLAQQIAVRVVAIKRLAIGLGDFGTQVKGGVPLGGDGAGLGCAAGFGAAQLLALGIAQIGGGVAFPVGFAGDKAVGIVAVVFPY